MRLGAEQIADLLPHAGRMCLIDGVRDWTEQEIFCVARSHRRADHPMARDGVLHAVCGLEYAAQAMALHGTLTADSARSKIGYIVSVRELVWQVERLDSIVVDLEIEAIRRAGDAGGVLYAFSLKAQDRVLLAGRAVVMLKEAER